MSSDLISWFRFFFNYMFNVFYSFKVPGTNIRLLYLLILASLVGIMISLFRRMLLQPTYNSRNSRSDRGSSGGESN